MWEKSIQEDPPDYAAGRNKSTGKTIKAVHQAILGDPVATGRRASGADAAMRPRSRAPIYCRKGSVPSKEGVGGRDKLLRGLQSKSPTTHHLNQELHGKTESRLNSVKRIV